VFCSKQRYVLPWCFSNISKLCIDGHNYTNISVWVHTGMLDTLHIFRVQLSTINCVYLNMYSVTKFVWKIQMLFTYWQLQRGILLLLHWICDDVDGGDGGEGSHDMKDHSPPAPIYKPELASDVLAAGKVAFCWMSSHRIQSILETYDSNNIILLPQE